MVVFSLVLILVVGGLGTLITLEEALTLMVLKVVLVQLVKMFISELQLVDFHLHLYQRHFQLAVH